MNKKAVINSVMHRDYFEGGHNNILKFFPDKLTITNVWYKPSWFRVGKDTFRRNQIIANLFLRMKNIFVSFFLRVKIIRILQKGSVKN